MSQLLKKQHCGKTWSQTPCNEVYDIHVANVKGNDQEGDYGSNSNDVHRLIFHLPLKYLRGGATSICEFKMTPEVISFMDSFCFYLNFIEELYMINKNEYEKYDVSWKRDKMKLFMENVRNTDGRIVALRFHLFVQCKYNLIKGIKDEILSKHKTLLRKRKRSGEKAKALAIHEQFKKIYDDFTWSKMVTSYKMQSECMDNAYQMYSRVTGDNTSNENEMRGVFGVETAIFRGKFINEGNNLEDCNICEIQKKLHLYEKNDVRYAHAGENYDGKKMSCFIFPVEKDVMLVHPSEVFITEIFEKKKYLPHYMMENVLLPKIVINTHGYEADTISMDTTSSANMCTVKLPKKHINIHINFIGNKKKTVKEYLQSITMSANEDDEYCTYEVPFHKLTEIKKTVKRFYQLCVLKSNTNLDYVEFGGEMAFFSFKNRYEHTSLEFLSLMYDSGKTFIDDPIERAALTDKNSMDSLDFLKYESILTKKKYENKEEFQRFIMNKFKNDVVENPYAIVSEPLRVIFNWGLAHKSHVIKRRKYKDWHNLNGNWKHENIFMNSINWKMDVFDNDLQVATGHSALMLLHHAKYDAYRQTMDLHMNIIFTGEGATSKSFLFEKMRQMSIPATVVELTYQTSKSDAIDGDRNDTITVFNEAPSGLFMTNKHTDPGDEARFKEKLTSQRVSVKTYEKDEDTGLRTNRTTVSQSIGVYMGATNDDPADATEAMSTRFYWGQFEKNERKNKTMNLCMQGEKKWNDIGEDLLENTMNDFRMEQYRMVLLFKLMYIGVLPYPTLETSEIVFMQLSDYLKKRKLNTSTRFKERFDIMCRIYTMTHALDLVFNYETNEKKCKKCTCNVDGDICFNNATLFKKGEDEPSVCFECGTKPDVQYTETTPEMDCCIGWENNLCGCQNEVCFIDADNKGYCMEHIEHVLLDGIDSEKNEERCISCRKCKKTAQYMFPGQTEPIYCIDHRESGMILYGNHCGMEFDVRQLLDVEPYLYCTEEIALFCFTQLSLEVCNPSEGKIIDSMYQLWKQKGCKYLDVKKDDSSKQDFNTSVIKLPNPRLLVKLISKNIPIQYGRPSDHNIKMVLKELGSRNITHIPYIKYDDGIVRPFALNDDFATYKQIKSGNKVILDEFNTTITDCYNFIDREIHVATELFKNSRLKDSNTVQNSEDHDPYSISGYEATMDPLAIHTDGEDILMQAVANVQHKYTKPKFVIFGLPHRDDRGRINTPNKFHYQWMNPDNKEIKVKNPIFKSNESIWRRQRNQLRESENYVGENINMDLNVKAVLSHCDKIYPPHSFVVCRDQDRMKKINQKISLQNNKQREDFMKKYGTDVYEKKYLYIEQPLISVNENESYIDRYSIY